MQRSSLEIHKNTFYTDGRAFSETAPPSECREHSVCGCTRYVSERPEDAIIGQMEIGMSLHSGSNVAALHKGELSVSASLGTFFFDSNQVTKDESDYIWYFVQPYENRVYLYVYRNKLRFQYSIPGYGYTDCMSTTIYRGNNHDRSKFMNGHSPSRIDTTVTDERQLWSHVCSWGKEAFALIESNTLNQMIDIGNELLDILADFQVSPDSEVASLYKSVKESSFEEKASQLESLLREFDLRNDPMFDILHSLDCTVRNTEGMFHERVL